MKKKAAKAVRPSVQEIMRACEDALHKVNSEDRRRYEDALEVLAARLSKLEASVARDNVAYPDRRERIINALNEGMDLVIAELDK